MIIIQVKIGRERIDTVSISNTGENLFGQTVYEVESEQNKSFHVLHDPKQGLQTLIAHVFSHYAMVDRWKDTPIETTEI